MSKIYPDGALAPATRKNLGESWPLVRAIANNVVRRNAIRHYGAIYRDHDDIVADVIPELVACFESVVRKFPDRDWTETIGHCARIAWRRVWHERREKFLRNGKPHNLGESDVDALAPADGEWTTEEFFRDMPQPVGVKAPLWRDVAILAVAYANGIDGADVVRARCWSVLRFQLVATALETYAKQWLAQRLA